MNRRLVLGILLALVLVAGAVSLGAYAYNLGLAQGLAQSQESGSGPRRRNLGPKSLRTTLRHYYSLQSTVNVTNHLFKSTHRITITASQTVYSEI